MIDFIQMVASGIAVGSSYALMGLAMVIIYKTSGVPNFAQGEMALISSFFAFMLLDGYGLPYHVSFPAAMLFAFVLGCFLEFVVLRRAKEPNVLGLIVITIGISILLREAMLHTWDEQLRALGAGAVDRLATLIWDGRFSLITAVLAGFGRAIAEVAAVMIVGGNIDHVTRTMTTAIALETSKGNLPLAIGLGILLMLIAFAVNAAVAIVRRASGKVAVI